jgi:hypothetical protein
MKIGLIGAPGAGKSKLAKALAKRYDLKVVDNYAQKIQKDTDLALGPWVIHSENLMVAGARLAAEYRYVKDDTITAGTIIDSLTYAAVKSDVSLRRDPESVRNTYITAQSAMHALTMMLAETWRYDICFFLPLEESVKKKIGQVWQVTLDTAYPLVLESYGLDYTYTLNGDFKDRLKVAEEAIDLVKTTQDAESTTTETPPPAERADGLRDGDGQEVRDTPEPLPDL